LKPALRLLVGQWADQTLRIAERSHAEEPERASGESIAVSGNERVRLRRPRLVIHRCAEHDRVVGVERLDLVDQA
jgi:hypothetical protein